MKRAFIINPEQIFSELGIPLHFNAKSLKVSMYKDLTLYFQKHNIDMKSKEETQIRHEYTHDSQNSSRGLVTANRIQRRLNAEKKSLKRLSKDTEMSREYPIM